MSGRKATRAKMISYCPDCATWVGVVQDHFNRSYQAQAWRLTKHSNAATQALCTASRALVADNVVFPNAGLEAAS